MGSKHVMYIGMALQFVLSNFVILVCLFDFHVSSFKSLHILFTYMINIKGYRYANK